MLWSAYYPCRQLRLSSWLLWTRQRPRLFRSPVRSARIGPGRRLSISNSRRGLRLRKAVFPFAGPGAIIYQLMARIYSVERLGEFRSTHTPVRVGIGGRDPLSLGRTGPPSLTPLGAAPRLWTSSAPTTPCAESPAGLPAGFLLDLSSRAFSSQLLPQPLARLAFTQAKHRTCSGLHVTPVDTSVHHPW